MYSFTDHKTFVVNPRQLCNARALFLSPEVPYEKAKTYPSF